MSFLAFRFMALLMGEEPLQFLSDLENKTKLIILSWRKGKKKKERKKIHDTFFTIFIKEL